MKNKFTVVVITTMLIFTACAPATPVQPTPDLFAIRTSAANTVVAEFTLTAAAFTPTFLPPTETQTPIPEQPTATETEAFTNDPTLAALGTPAALCDDYDWNLATLDVTILDGTPMTPSQEFVKTWKIRNTGICTWGEGYQLIFSYSNPPNLKMNGQPVPLPSLIAPGEEIDVSVNLKAPTTPGEYTAYWQMVNSKGIPFGKKQYILSVKIVVQ
ncbi:MAG: NBR1-Ig-like domain-containing protein [Chloroflexi bacterium]|nr:NBR1-Ig-like domain-containing protein [Chloroflexota bacterium]